MVFRRKIWLDLLILIVFVGALVLFISCKRTSKDLDFIGPQDYKAATANFVVYSNEFKASNDNANFLLRNLSFESKFSEKVTWTITIVGLQSHAVKTISGTSDSITASNSIWDGSTSNVYFFRKDEMCIAELKILGSSIALKDTVKIVSVKKYSGVFNGVKYTLIDDFDGGGVPMSGVSKDQLDTKTIMKTDTLVKMQGGNSFRMAGLDLNNNSWSGGINHLTLLELKKANQSPKIKDPSQLYINLYVYGTGKENSGLQVKMYEVDNIDDFNGISLGVYNAYVQNKNDAWILDLPISWKGWKLVSVRYSSFRPASDPTLGGSGNKIQQPDQISGMGVSLLSIPNSGGDTEAYIDFVVLTEGGPFVP